MALCTARRVKVNLKKVNFLCGINEKIKSKQLKAAILVLDLAAAEDGISDDVVDLLVVLPSEVTQCLAKQVLQHHNGRHLVVFLDGLEDTVVGQMDFLIEFA